MNNVKKLKLIKRGYKSILKQPEIFFNKENTSYITKGIAYANNITNNNFKIHIIELENPKKW